MKSKSNKIITFFRRWTLTACKSIRKSCKFVRMIIYEMKYCEYEWEGYDGKVSCTSVTFRVTCRPDRPSFPNQSFFVISPFIGNDMPPI